MDGIIVPIFLGKYIILIYLLVHLLEQNAQYGWDVV